MSRAIRRLLVANRAEIARRVFRTARSMGIATVAVYSDADADAPHVRDADSAVALGGILSVDSYLRIDKIIDAARSSGADAVHPGYGFLSENADFAQAVVDAGLIWIGPSAAAIRALGSKSACKALGAQHGVPTLPSYFGEDQSDARLVREAERIGFPVMVKAAAGGGGRGMRLVHAAQELPAALHSARAEAKASFGSEELLLERALLAPRHVEVQVFGDAHGRVIHLGERDCSMQRRHQKIIEEAPSPAVDAALRARMGESAVALARAAGYSSAGTVEFLMQDGAFYLMEMNTRLQVEHPVTEAITGLDLVEWQIRVARGEPLPLEQSEIRFNGHAIEVRICAEDERFVPQAGVVHHFAEPAAIAGLRFDHALLSGQKVPPYYDSMLGKLIAHAPTRTEAVARLCAALADTSILGLPTNIDLLRAALAHPVFTAGQALVPSLGEMAEDLAQGIIARERAALMACVVAAHANAAASSLPYRGFRPVRVLWRGQRLDVALAQREYGVWLAVLTDAQGDTQDEAVWQAEVLRSDASSREVRIRRLDSAWFEAQPSDRSFCSQSPWSHLRLVQSENTYDAITEVDGHNTRVRWIDVSYEPPAATDRAAGDAVCAPMAGRIVEVCAAPGQSVQAGQVLVVLEAMKLQHRLCAPRAGVVAQLTADLGAQVVPRQLLVSLEPVPAL